MAVTITDKTIDGDYVKLTLSNGEEVAIQVDWATKFVQEPVEDEDGNVTYVDTEKSLLEHEIQKAVDSANERVANTEANTEAAQTIIDEV